MTVKVKNIKLGGINIDVNLLSHLMFMNPLLLEDPCCIVVDNIEVGLGTADFSQINGGLKFNFGSGFALKLQMVGTHAKLITARIQFLKVSLQGS